MDVLFLEIFESNPNDLNFTVGSGFAAQRFDKQSYLKSKFKWQFGYEGILIL